MKFLVDWEARNQTRNTCMKTIEGLTFTSDVARDKLLKGSGRALGFGTSENW